MFCYCCCCSEIEHCLIFSVNEVELTVLGGIKIRVRYDCVDPAVGRTAGVFYPSLRSHGDIGRMEQLS